MLLQSIIALTIVLVYIVWLFFKKNIGVAYSFFKDSMQGKQMVIDTDLKSGAITEAEAQNKRKDIAGRMKRIEKTNRFVEHFNLVYSSVIFILLLINTGLILFKPEAVRIYSILIILINIVIIALWIVWGQKVKLAVIPK